MVVSGNRPLGFATVNVLDVSSGAAGVLTDQPANERAAEKRKNPGAGKPGPLV
jgi:hypothetical protein